MDTIGNRINQLGAGRTVGAAVRPGGRRVRDPGAVAGRGRSGAREGVHRHGGGAGNRRREGRPVPQPRSGPGAARRRAAAEHQAGQGQAARRLAKASSGTWWQDSRSSPAARCATRAPARTSSASGRPISRLSPDGGKRFGRYTEANIGNKLAVVLDNQIVSVATIQARIEDSGRITGLGSEAGSRRPVALPAFRLAAGRRRCTSRSAPIGPSLGADSIHQGIVAGVAGLLAVIVVMLVYYKRGRQRGAGADAEHRHPAGGAVLFPRRADPAGHRRRHPDHRYGGGFQRADFRAHPRGVAGRQGVIAAVDTGFSKAWWTIVDTHVTTVVSCAFLFLFGKGRCADLR